MISLDDISDYQPKAQLLANRVILITGAGDGIGRTVAEYCGRHKATVILLGRTEKKLEQVYDRLLELESPKPAIFTIDLERATSGDCHALADTIRNEYGRLDGLLHNAGILGDSSPIEHYDADVWEKVIRINVTSNFLLTQALLPLLRASEDASIIFTSSTVGRVGRAYWGAYCVSKFATEGLMQVVADETEENTHIRSNTLNPGATRTAMRAQAYPGENPNILPTPEDIVNPYLYLLGPDSRGITGQAFNAQKKKKK